MSFNIGKKEVIVFTGGIAFMLIMTKITRDHIMPAPKTMDRGGRDSLKNLDELEEQKNYGTEATSKSLKRQDFLDRTGYLAGMNNTFRDPQLDLLARPAQYYTTGDTTLHKGNPMFDK
jgi:hypothetical protein